MKSINIDVMSVLPYGIPQGWMFVPAREKSVKNTGRFNTADVLIFDLEDSLKEEEKDEGLRLVKNLDINQKAEGQKFFARLNKERLERELSELCDSCLDGYMFPKFEGTGELDEFNGLIKNKTVAALIETPAGVADIDTFAGDERISALAFGAEDFCACLNVETNPYACSYARGRIVLYSALYKKTSVDMISKEFKDEGSFREELILSLKTGFDGKLLIHPMQLKCVDEIRQSIPKEEIRSIIERYESDPKGAVRIGGKLYEGMHIERLKKILEE